MFEIDDPVLLKRFERVMQLGKDYFDRENLWPSENEVTKQDVLNNGLRLLTEFTGSLIHAQRLGLNFNDFIECVCNMTEKKHNLPPIKLDPE